MRFRIEINFSDANQTGAFKFEAGALPSSPRADSIKQRFAEINLLNRVVRPREKIVPVKIREKITARLRCGFLCDTLIARDIKLESFYIDFIDSSLFIDRIYSQLWTILGMS